MRTKNKKGTQIKFNNSYWSMKESLKENDNPEFIILNDTNLQFTPFSIC